MPNVRTSIEGQRGCGYRQPGGFYLVGGALADACPLLPYPLTACGACGQGIHPARGWTWIIPSVLVPATYHGSWQHAIKCPLGTGGRQSENDSSFHHCGPRAGLIWIGESFYATPKDFLDEAAKMGVSRRIKAVPRGFELGQWVFLGHRKALQTAGPGLLDPSIEIWSEGERVPADFIPGVIALFQPTAIEYIVRGDESEEYLASLERRGIDSVRVVRDVEQQPLALA